jgi:Uma2 family endonuclease
MTGQKRIRGCRPNWAVISIAGEGSGIYELTQTCASRFVRTGIPDICIYNEPAPKDRYPSALPLLWVEILSPSDIMIDVWGKANELIRCGVPYVWIIDPETLESELRTASGITHINDKTLSLPGTSIVIPLENVLNE